MPLKIIYGSPHGSAPRLSRYGIEPGDRIFVVTLKRRVLSVVVRARVRTLMSEAALEKQLWAAGDRLPFSCIDEAARLTESTPFGAKVEIPSPVLAKLRFRPRTGAERALRLMDGELKSAVSLQGHFFRLAPASGAALDRVLAKAGVAG